MLEMAGNNCASQNSHSTRDDASCCHPLTSLVFRSRRGGRAPGRSPPGRDFKPLDPKLLAAKTGIGDVQLLISSTSWEGNPPNSPRKAGASQNAPKSQTSNTERKGRCRTSCVLTFIFSDPPKFCRHLHKLQSCSLAKSSGWHHPKVVIGTGGSAVQEQEPACLVVGLNLVQLGSDKTWVAHWNSEHTHPLLFLHDPCPPLSQWEQLRQPCKMAQASGSSHVHPFNFALVDADVRAGPTPPAPWHGLNRLTRVSTGCRRHPPGTLRPTLHVGQLRTGSA